MAADLNSFVGGSASSTNAESMALAFRGRVHMSVNIAGLT
ncbi:Uncharacterised protein [Mycobacterium tuberculosis]|uniref:Uncharacterized protein n=2 Tax=Mycobacterium tuberculosis TaxID=1773 RepID=Q8VJY1_MYCTO|nr:hypothetical protein MT1771.1 [Mycobacterium tuberculosis CDC1551]AOZ42918.1 hypothetical protein BTB1458_1917 [Mycobacterium tuberculosis]COY85429.1 Uncharacterised protein [Mycobacterium tuberculosis]COZ83231.1 Uncharacterised protein [Mycobacterium tuberculosis]CPB14081.1 Uncharacterised protein [Mycobacterium tuberculosis]